MLRYALKLLSIVYFMFALIKERVGFVDEGGAIFFSVDFFQITSSES